MFESQFTVTVKTATISDVTDNIIIIFIIVVVVIVIRTLD